MKRFEAPRKGTAWLAALVLAVAAPHAAFAAGDPVEPTVDFDTNGDSYDVPDLEGLDIPGVGVIDLSDGGRQIRIGGGPNVFVGHRGREGQAVADAILDAADDLDLTDAQRTKLRDIRRKAPSALMPKRQAVVEARMELSDLMESKDANSVALRKAHDQLLEARKQLSSAQFDLRMQAREVLTPEQLDKLNDLRVETRHEIRNRIRGSHFKMRRYGWDQDEDRDVIIEKF